MGTVPVRDAGALRHLAHVGDGDPAVARILRAGGRGVPRWPRGLLTRRQPQPQPQGQGQGQDPDLDRDLDR